MRLPTADLGQAAFTDNGVCFSSLCQYCGFEMGQTGLGGQENEIKSLSLSKTCCGKRRNTQTSRIHLQTRSDPGSARLRRKAGVDRAGRGP